MKPSRADRQRRDHAEAMARLREVTGRPFAPRRARVRLAGAYLAATAVAGAAPLVSSDLWAGIVGIVAVVGIVTLWLALRRTTRLVTEAPDEFLDELLVRLRDRYYREAYRLLGAAVVLMAALLLTVGGDGTGAAGCLAAAVVMIALANGLPLVVAAFLLPDIDDDET